MLALMVTFVPSNAAKLCFSGRSGFLLFITIVYHDDF